MLILHPMMSALCFNYHSHKNVIFPKRFWEVDFPMEGETCIGKQNDNSCTSIYVPNCEDRNVYCTTLNPPGTAVQLTGNQ